MTQVLTRESASGVERVRGHGRKRLPGMNVEQLLLLSRHLALSDRALVQSVYERGMSPTALARSMNAQPNAVHKRLRRVVERVASPLFGYVARHRDTLPDDQRAIAEAVVLRGMTLRAAARSLRLSPYRVRSLIQRLQILSEASGR